MINITKGIQIKPYRLLIYSSPGKGKSSLANLADKPLFLNMEDGLHMIDCEATEKVTTMKEFIEVINFFKTSDYKTLVVDCLDNLEQVLHKNICQAHGVDSIEKVEKGFGKGYTIACEKFQQILDMLDNTGKNYILIAHEKLKTIIDPTTENCDKYIIKMNDKAASFITARVDAVLFIRDEIHVRDDKGKVIGRYIYTKDNGSFVAKNRYGLPDKIDFGILEKGRNLFNLIHSAMKKEGKDGSN